MSDDMEKLEKIENKLKKDNCVTGSLGNTITSRLLALTVKCLLIIAKNAVEAKQQREHIIGALDGLKCRQRK